MKDLKIQSRVKHLPENTNKELHKINTDILTINNELNLSKNTLYKTSNGIKQFLSKCGYIDNLHINGETQVINNELISIGQGDRIDILNYGGEQLIINENEFKHGFKIEIDNNGEEILSQDFSYTLNYIEVKPNTRYLIKSSLDICEYNKDKNFIPTLKTSNYYNLGSSNYNLVSLTTSINTKYIRISIPTKHVKYLELYESGEYDKRTIFHTLRSLPNGIRDEVIQQGNRYYLIKRCGEKTFDGSEGAYKKFGLIVNNTIRFILSEWDDNLSKESSSMYCNLFINNNDIYNSNGEEGVSISSNADSSDILFAIKIDKLSTVDENGFMEYLANNNCTFTFELKKPVIIELTNINVCTYKSNNLFLNSGSLQGNASFEVVNSLGSSLEVASQKIGSIFRFIDDDRNILINKINSLEVEILNLKSMLYEVLDQEEDVCQKC